MVALKKQPEQRHYECGPIRQDVPLRIYATEETPQPVPWFVEFILVAGFLGLVALVAVAMVW